MVEEEEEGPGEEQRVGEKKTARQFLFGSKPPKLWQPGSFWQQAYMYVLAGGHVTSITSFAFAPQSSPPPWQICAWIFRPLQTTLIQRANSRSRRRAIRRDATPPRRSRSSSATTTRSPGISRHEICPKIYTAGFSGQKSYTHHWRSAVWVIKTQTNEWKWIILHRWQNFYTATRKSHLWEHHCQKGSGLKNQNLKNQTKTKYLNFAARSCKSPKICHLLHHHDLDHL